MLRISEFILNSCWQIAVIMAIAGLGSWLLKNGPARYQHALWVVALTTSLIVPLLTSTHFLSLWVSSLDITTASTRPAAVVGPKEVAPVARKSDAEDLAVDRLKRRYSQTISTNSRTTLLLTLGYAVFILVRIIRLTRFWQRQKRLRRSATPTGLSEVQTAAERCRKLFGVKSVVVARSAEALLPYTLGARQPLIVLPEAFCESADEARLTSIIGHEMAHVARRDFLTNMLCELMPCQSHFTL